MLTTRNYLLSTNILIATSAAHTFFRSLHHHHHPFQTWMQNQQDYPRLHRKPSHPRQPANNSSTATITWHQLQIQLPAARRTRKSLGPQEEWHPLLMRWNLYHRLTHPGKETTLEDHRTSWDLHLFRRLLREMLSPKGWPASTSINLNTNSNNLHHLEHPLQEG